MRRASASSTRSSAATDEARRADNWPMLREVWPPTCIRHAEAVGVRIGIENCPMLFSSDEWPGGKNLADSPADLAQAVRELPSAAPRPQLRSVAPDLAAHRLRSAASASSASASSTSTPRTRASTATGCMSRHLGLGWHTPKLPGLGDVDWTAVFRRPDRHRLHGGRVHRGRGPGLRGIAGRSQARAAAEQAVSGAVHDAMTVFGWVHMIGRTIAGSATRLNDDASRVRRSIVASRFAPLWTKTSGCHWP